MEFFLLLSLDIITEVLVVLAVAVLVGELFEQIGLFVGVFLIGFEMTTQTVRAHIVPSLAISGTSFVLPFAIFVATGALLLPFGFTADLLVALAIGVPSISIASVLVMELDLVQKETGKIILSSVTITDIIALILSGRGAVGIVIASVALSAGLIGGTAYSLVVIGTVVASIVVPAMAGRRRLYS